MMGGSAKILAKGRELMQTGQVPRMATEILNKLVFAEPTQPAGEGTAGRRLRAARLPEGKHQPAQQLPRRAPSNCATACRVVPPRTTGPDVIRAMSTEQWLDFLGISMDPRKAEGMQFTINLVTPDNGEQYLIELSNATLTNIKGEQAEEAGPDDHAEPY
jgi:alkyl sulfatase BDS1-like metallo-beta-lactamase superfamily hydrolase